MFSFFILLLLTALKPSNAFAGNFPFTIDVNQADTSNISAIQVTLGSTDGASDLLSYTFIYDVKTGLPSGLAYERKNNNISLTLGSFTVRGAMYGTYVVKDKSGNTVVTKKFLYK